MPEKIRCPERDLSSRHPDLMTGALTTELPRQPQWSESNIGYRGNHSGVSQILATKETSITRHLLPDLSDWELLL